MISNLTLFGFLTFNIHGTTHFLYITGDDVKVAKSVELNSISSRNSLVIDKKLSISNSASKFWTLNLSDDFIKFFVANISDEREISGNQISKKFQYNVDTSNIDEFIYPNKEEAIVLLPVVLKILLHGENFENLKDCLLLINRNFDRFEDFFASSKGIEWYEYEGKIEKAIKQAQDLPKILKIAQGVSNIMPVTLLSVGAVLGMKNYEQASEIINMVNCFIVFVLVVCNFFAETIFGTHPTNEDFIEFTPVKRLIPYYVLSGEKEQLVKKIEKIIKNRNEQIDFLSSNLLKEMYDNV